MKLGTQVLLLIVSATALFLYAQGRGMINRVEREKVITIISNLKPEMTEAEALGFLKNHGLDLDWSAIGSHPTNEVQLWYRYGTTNIEELRVTFRPKQDMTFELWQKQHRTNNSFFKAQMYKSEKGGLQPIPFTNAPNQNSGSNRS